MDPNTTFFDGRSISFGQLEMSCKPVPFLAEWRLMVVDGLLDRFDERPGRRPVRRAARGDPGRSLQEWEGLAAMVEAMPPTTVLVLLGGRLNPRNPLVVQLRSLAEMREYPALRGGQLRQWAQDRVAQRGGKASPGALRLLTDFIGGNLRQLDSEIQKLCLYVGPRPIGEEDVTNLVSDAREAGIFALVDAMIEGKGPEAMRTLRQIMDQGAAGPYIVTMLARQVRMMLQAKALEQERASDVEIAQALGTTSDFVLRKTLEQAQSYTAAELNALHRRLLDTDVAIKTGAMAEELGMETLVAEVARGMV